MLKGFFTGIGQVAGEIACQSGKLYDATAEVSNELYEDIKNIPEDMGKGYDKELFTTKEKEEVKEKVKDTAATIIDKMETVTAEIKEKVTSTSNAFKEATKSSKVTGATKE